MTLSFYDIIIVNFENKRIVILLPISRKNVGNIIFKILLEYST